MAGSETDLSSTTERRDEDDGWASSEPRKDDLAVAIEKETIIKDIMQTQEGLKALLSRVEEVSTEVRKYTDENAMLQVYLDNMTKNTAMFAGQKPQKR